MADFGEILADIANRLNEFNESGVRIDKNLLEETNFYSQMTDMGLSGVDGNFAISGDPGHYDFTNGGEKINIDEAVNDIHNHGDIIASLEELHIPEDVFDSPPVKEYASAYKNNWNHLPGNQDIEGVEETMNNGKVLEEETQSDPKNPKDAETHATDELKKEVDKLKKDLEKNGKASVGKWVKRTIIFGGGALGLLYLYNEILNHQKIMNGCWLVDIKTGEKCKLPQLTCHNLSDEELPYVCKPYFECGPKHISKCFPNNTTCTEKVCDARCSNNSTIEVPPNKRLQCVEVNFWGAASDFLKTNLFDIKFWLYIGLAVALFIVIILVIK